MGNPPRQTEDPLSPPCVPFFDGDNGGSTAPGVTGDEIRVVFYNDIGLLGELSEPWTSPDAPGGSGDGANLFRTAKALVRYFNSRYQTYDRTVRVFAWPSVGGPNAPCGSRRADAHVVVEQLQPFAAMAFGPNMRCFVEQLASELAIPTLGAMTDLSRSTYETAAPYVWSFMPDLTTIASLSAGFICRTLAGAPARFSTDPLLASRNRSFGLVYRVGDTLRSPSMASSELLQAALSETCGDTFTSVDALVGDGIGELPLIMAKYRLLGITTLVCYCSTSAEDLMPQRAQAAATAVGYFPEWYWDASTGMDRAGAQRSLGEPHHVSFGTSSWWRQPPFEQTFAYQAYLSEEPGTVPEGRHLFWIYHALLVLFQGVQAAGPNLNLHTLERGLNTFNYLDRSDPFVPIGGFGAYNSGAVGNHTFVDTGMGWWWDPAALADGVAAPGCVRVMRKGLRLYADEWPPNDGDLFVGVAPCAGDIERAFP